MKTTISPVLGHVPEDSRKTVDARGVHGLNGIVDDEESKRARVQGGAGKKKSESEGMKLSLAHDAECGSLGAVHGDVEIHFAGRGFSFERHVFELDAASGPQELPDALDLLLDGLKALVAESGRCGADPVLGVFQLPDGIGLPLHLACSGKPLGQR